MIDSQASGVILRRHVVWVMLEAGLDPEQLPEAHALDERDPARAHGTFRFQVAEAEPQEEAQIRLSAGEGPKVTGIDVNTTAPALAERLRTLLGIYAANPDAETYRGQKAVEAQDTEAWRALDVALDAARIPRITEDRRRRALDAATARVLMEVYEKNPSFRARERVLFALQAPKTAKAVKATLASWLIEQFARFENRRHRGQIGCALLDLAGPAQAPGLGELIADARLGTSRAVLLDVLGKTRAPSAATVLAGQLDGPFKVPALRGLQHLGARAADHARAVEATLRDPAPEVRRLARQVLKKMGIEVAPPPPPVHLVTAKASPPAHFVEWSTNLDLDDLADALGVLGSTADHGLGAREAAEVLGVVESMRLDQTRTFRFPVSVAGREREVWVAIFLDDVEAPDLYVNAEPDVVGRIEAAWRTSRFAER